MQIRHLSVQDTRHLLVVLARSVNSGPPSYEASVHVTCHILKTISIFNRHEHTMYLQQIISMKWSSIICYHTKVSSIYKALGTIRCTRCACVSGISSLKLGRAWPNYLAIDFCGRADRQADYLYIPVQTQGLSRGEVVPSVIFVVRFGGWSRAAKWHQFRM